jgi:hypothetical protein
MDTTLVVVCVWIAGMITGVYLGALDAKDKTPMHVTTVILGPLGVALLFAFCISFIMSLAPHLDLDVMTDGIVEFFSQ